MIAINYNGTTHKTTPWKMDTRYRRYLRLKALFDIEFPEEKVNEMMAKNCYYSINGDLEILDVSIIHL
jgi:hypothetical protein